MRGFQTDMGAVLRHVDILALPDDAAAESLAARRVITLDIVVTALRTMEVGGKK